MHDQHFHVCQALPSLLITLGSSPAFCSHQAPSQPSCHARLLPGLLVTPGSFPALWSCQAPSLPCGHARLLPCLVVMPGSSPCGFPREEAALAIQTHFWVTTTLHFTVFSYFDTPYRHKVMKYTVSALYIRQHCIIGCFSQRLSGYV